MEEIYKNAFAEVCVVLEHMPSNYVTVLPKKLLYFLEDNKNSEYNFQIELNKKISEQNISIEAKAILANLYRDFWVSEKKKIEILKNEELQREIYQKKLSVG